MVKYPPLLTWKKAEYGGTHTLMYEGKIVGRAWVPMREDRRRKPVGAWDAGNEELGVPDSGVNEAANLEEAKTACQFWVTIKGKLPPGPGPEPSNLR